MEPQVLGVFEMKTPRDLREQLKFYANNGFHAVDIEPRAGAHFYITFAEFPQKQLVTRSATDPHAWRNNLANYRRLQKEYAEEIYGEKK